MKTATEITIGALGCIELASLALPAVILAAKRQGSISSVAEAFSILAAKGSYGVAEPTATVLPHSVSEA